jgi:hypothetical protein
MPRLMVEGEAYLFAHDVLDEMPSVVVDRLQQAGLMGAAMAAAYHHSRDVFPHNPRRSVVYLEGGTVYFRPDFSRYEAPLVPRIARIAQDSDPLALLGEAGQVRGLNTSAWLVVLHNTRLAFEAPELAPLTALGDRLLNTLCPAQPKVRGYAVALAGDVARYGLESIKLEALSYMPFDHGYHHERSFVRLSPNVRFLLGLCFCAACEAHASSRGIDIHRVRTWVSDRIRRVFESAHYETFETDVNEGELREACDGDLGRFLDARLAVVTSLADAVTRAVHEVAAATRVVFLDLSGGTLGYATGRPTTEASAESIAWRDGIDLPAVGYACGGVGVLGYFAEPDRLEREVRAYQRRLQEAVNLEVLLRPMPPDSATADDLQRKVDVLRRAGVRGIGFYHYGMMRLEALDWIAGALQGA